MHSSGRRAKKMRTGEILGVIFFFQAEDGIRDLTVTGVQTCALPISIVAESISSGPGVKELFPCADVKSFFGIRGGGIGWGLPATLGVKLALPDRPVVRSGERRGGEEGRSRWSPYHLKKKIKKKQKVK